MGLIAILFYEVALDSLSDWHSLWYFSTVVTALLVFYSNIAATSLKIFTSGVYILMLIIHIVAF